MLNLEDDMPGVFFSDDFCTRLLRTRAGQAAAEIVGILGIADEEALQGRVVAAVRTLRAPSGSDVRADDVLQALAAVPLLGIAEGERFRVLEEPVRMNDGAEMEALLGSVQA